MKFKNIFFISLILLMFVISVNGISANELVNSSLSQTNILDEGDDFNEDLLNQESLNPLTESEEQPINIGDCPISVSDS